MKVIIGLKLRQRTSVAVDEHQERMYGCTAKPGNDRIPDFCQVHTRSGRAFSNDC